MKKLFDNSLLCIWRALMYSAIPLLLGSLMPGGNQFSAGAYYFCGQALALTLGFAPARIRVACMVLCGACYAAAGVYLLGVIAYPVQIIIIVLCLAAYGLTLRAQGAAVRYDSREMIAGAIIHVLPPVIIRLSDMAVNYTPMMICGAIYLFMCPYIMNSMSVRDGMSLRGRGGKPIGRISNKNRIMVTGLMVIALLIACADKIQAAFQRAGEFVMYWIGQFIMWLSSLIQGSEEISGEGATESGDMAMGLEAGEPGWFAVLMEQIIKYVAIAALAAALCFALWKLGKLLKKLYVRIAEWAKQFAQGVREDYVEEQEQLMDWGEVRGEVISSFKDALKKLAAREKKWADMDARERVRSVVKQLYRKRGMGISGIECLSVREAMREMNIDDDTRAQLGKLYDEARYSSHEITETEVETARRMVR